jgi:predicted RNA-binding protein with PIN domain
MSLLDDVVSAARATLRELDSPEIPASLHRVAAYTGGKLPPPLAVSLLDELDKNEWFRGKVRESLKGTAASAATLFLERPDGWWIELAKAAGSAETDQGESQLADLQRQITKLEEKLRKATEKAAELQRQLDVEKTRTRDLIDSAKSATAARFRAEVDELATVRAGAAQVAVRLEQLEAEHQELQEAFAALRNRFARTRRLRLDAGTATGPPGSMTSDPVKLARLLDLQTASYGRAPQAVAARKEDTPVRDLSLDPGVRPDSADAIRWLLGLTEPVTVLIDGYNAQFHIDRSDFTSGTARRNLVGALRRLRESGETRHRIVVVFDSTLPGERIPRSALGGVEVRFTEQDVIADEEIVAMIEHLDRAVVISSDREVREGAEAGGAIVLWSEALAEWMERL